MELKELSERTKELFGIEDINDLGNELRKACSDEEKLQAFYDLVDGDLETDWLQMIYQYYQADRKEKKQDYTPKSLARFMSLLAGSADHVTDLCAGSGALIIQRWAMHPDTKFTAVEIDENVFPYLMFNMVIRNISCKLYRADSLDELQPIEAYLIKRGERFGTVSDIKPTL